MITRHTKCPFCGDTKDIELTNDEQTAMLSGKHIQEVLPHLSKDDRERLISGTCPECWDSIFRGEDDI